MKVVQANEDTSAAAILAREKARHDEELRVEKEELNQMIAELEKLKECDVARAAAITPDLIAALKAIGDKQLLGEMSENLNLVAALGGSGLIETLKKIVSGTPLTSVLDSLNQ